MSKSTNFKNIIEFTLKHEGGYINHPNDPGGETNFGISKRSFPDLNIKNLTKYDAKNIYYEYYWKKLKCYKLPDLISQAFFDSCVNMGRKRTSKQLQKSINNLLGFQLLIVDGLIGPITRNTINNIQDDEKLTRIFILNRIEYYVKLCNKNHKFRVFLLGWLNRSLELRKFLISTSL